MFKFTKSIEEAVKQCQEFGGSTINLNDENKTWVNTEWEPFDNDNNYDVVTVYIGQNGIIRFKYQIEETKTKAEK